MIDKRTIRPREKLEFIIDSCSSGKSVLNGVDRLIRYSMEREPRVFDDYRIVMPIQLGTETKRYLFPDFLRARLDLRPHGPLEEFYHTHRNKIKIVETDVSLAFKWNYGAQAARILQNHPQWVKEIARNARELQAQLAPSLKYPEATLTTPRLEMLCGLLKKSHISYETEFGVMRRAMVKHSRETGASDADLERSVRNAENTKMNRYAQDFFDRNFTQSNRIAYQYLLQAMYAHDNLNREVVSQTNFSSFRKDKGERAIESFLFSERRESHPNRVTVIISEDAGARRNIQRLRRQSENTIFCVSTYGFAIAHQRLGMIRTLDQMVNKRTLTSIIQQRDEQTQTFAEQYPSSKPSMENVLDRRVEQKWAERLVQVMRFGEWRDTPRHLRHFTNGPLTEQPGGRA